MVVEHEQLVDRRAVEPVLRGWEDVVARPDGQALLDRPAREDLDPLVDVGDLLGDGGHVDRLPAAGLVRVEDHDRELGRCARLRECRASGEETQKSSR